MRHFRKLLVATDTRLEKHPIVDEAAVIADHNGASLTIVDVLPLFPWIVRVSLPNHQEILDLMIREKQEQLDKLAAPIRDRGIDVETKVLVGKTSVEIIRQVMRGRHDLVIRVAKGRDSSRNSFFGTTGIRLLRECPCAVWLVAPASSPKYKHVLGCIDTSSDASLDAELNSQVFETATLVSQKHSCRLSIVHAWRLDGEEFLLTRMNQESLESLKRKGRKHIATRLDQFLRLHDSSILEHNMYMLKGRASDVIPSFASTQAVDLVVMGTVARSGLAGM
ncbi:MAG: universal stress protein, partial [Aureliella sp.]